MINNKRGGEKLFSIWWILILGLVGVGVVYGVLLFFSQEIDIRNFESALIYSKVSSCIIKNNLIIDEFFEEDFNLYTYCSINQEVFDKSFYLRLVVLDIQGNLDKEIILGNIQYQKQCEIVFDSSNTPKIKATNYPVCYSGKESVSYFLNNQKIQGGMEILSASNNQGKRASSL